MTIREISERLKNELLGYTYGFVHRGIRYTPKDDPEYALHFQEFYRAQEVSVSRKERIGTCIDSVLVMQALMKEYGVPSRIYLLCQREKPHTVLTFQAEGKTVYLELTPSSSRPNYAKELIYADEAEWKEAWNKTHLISEITDILKPGIRPQDLIRHVFS